MQQQTRKCGSLIFCKSSTRFQAEFGEAHGKAVLHETAVLLQRRSKICQDAGTWKVFGGLAGPLELDLIS